MSLPRNPQFGPVGFDENLIHPDDRSRSQFGTGTHQSAAEAIAAWKGIPTEEATRLMKEANAERAAADERTGRAVDLLLSTTCRVIERMESDPAFAWGPPEGIIWLTQCVLVLEATRGRALPSRERLLALVERSMEAGK